MLKNYAQMIGRYVINYITSKLPSHLYQELIIEEELPLLLTLVMYFISMWIIKHYNQYINIITILKPYQYNRLGKFMGGAHCPILLL